MMRSRNALMALVFGVALVIAGLVQAAPAARAATLPARYVLPGDSVFPEGVTFQAGTGVFYVSSVGTGTIFRGNIRQEAAEVFLPGGQDGRTTATGLKVDQRGRLFVAGASSGKVFVYDTSSRALIAAFDNDLSSTFINDIALASDGTAYATDSFAPYLYRVTTRPDGRLAFETWIDFTGSPLVYQPGFNLNGIAVSNNDRYLIVVQANSGRLFRIDTVTKEVRPIDLGGETVTNGDGLLLLGPFLYVVRNTQELIVKVQLSRDLLRGTIVSSTTDPSFAIPTTIARAQDRLLVVNSQFDRFGPGLVPDLPFTVSSVPIP